MFTEERAFWIDAEGGKIFGIFSKGKNDKPLVILVHGWSGNHLGSRNRFFVTAARFFADEGLNVMRFDFRGSGNSTGEFENQTITSMIEDLVTLEEYALEHFDFNGKVVLVGHSQGFYVSLFAVQEMKRVAGLVSWAGRVSDLKDFQSVVWFEELERKGRWAHSDFVVTKAYVKDSMNYRSSEAITKLALPVLLVYGEKDDVVPPSEGLKFLKFYGGKNAKLEILDDLNHYFEGEKVKEKVLSLTYRWIEETITPLS